MIIYTNVQPTVPHLAFIGRWSPFHKGHVAIIEKKRKEHPKLPVLIMVRDTPEQFSSTLRAAYIKSWMRQHRIRGTIMIIPNIEGIYWGRDVGYRTGYIDVDKNLQRISGSNVRESIGTTNRTWVPLTADPKNSGLLSPVISDILERGRVVWLTGSPASGKTTISNRLRTLIRSHYPYVPVTILDGDVLRQSPLAKNAGFSREERALHITKMAYVAKLLADRGTVVICAFVSPDRAVRKKARTIIGGSRFFEVAVRASLATRIKRDKKGLYKKARRGDLTNLTGFNAPYEEPVKPDILCDTDTQRASACASHIASALFHKKRVTAKGLQDQ